MNEEKIRAENFIKNVVKLTLHLNITNNKIDIAQDPSKE